MKMGSNDDLVLALAGIFQAAKLVKDLAWQGKTNDEYFVASINSLFTLNSNSVTEVYGNAANLKLGLEELIKLFDNNKNHNPKCQEIARYVFSLIHLERKLIKNDTMLATIKSGLIRAENQTNLFSVTHENVMANLAGIYTDTLSKFSFRIHVTGNQNILQNSNVANKVRALLLTGIRSAVLWRQLGGSRFHLIFNRKKIVSEAKSLL